MNDLFNVAFRYVFAAAAPYYRLYFLLSHPTGYILFCETLMCVQYNRIRNLPLPPETYRLAHLICNPQAYFWVKSQISKKKSPNPNGYRQNPDLDPSYPHRNLQAAPINIHESGLIPAFYFWIWFPSLVIGGSGTLWIIPIGNTNAEMFNIHQYSLEKMLVFWERVKKFVIRIRIKVHSI